MFRFFVLLFLSSSALFADPLSISRSAELRAQFQRRQQLVKSWQCTFTQAVQMPGMRQPVLSMGSLIYKAPGQLRLDFSKPEGDRVIIHGERLLIQKMGKKPSEKSLSKDRAGRPFLSLIGLLSGHPLEEESHYEHHLSRENADYILILDRKPGSPGHLPRRMINTFSADSLEIHDVLVELPNKGSIRYRFSDVIRNRAVDAGKFLIP